MTIRLLLYFSTANGVLKVETSYNSRDNLGAILTDSIIQQFKNLASGVYDRFLHIRQSNICWVVTFEILYLV
jgi:hypothetical protein